MKKNEYHVEQKVKEMYPLTELANKIMKTDYDTDEERDCKWNLCLAFKLTGKIGFQRLNSSFAKVIDENVAMHSKVSDIDGEYYIYVDDSYEFNIKIINVDSNEMAMSEARRWASVPIDVINNIPIQVVMFKVNDKESFILMKAHHVITDASSLILIIKNVIKYYINPNDKNIDCYGSYQEFMIEELEFEKTERAKEEIAFWEKEFVCYEPIKFPVDYRKENGPSYNLSNFSLDTQKLQEVAKKNKTSVFNVVLSIFHMAYAKVNGVSDTALYYLYENRMNSKYSGTIGCITRVIANRYIFEKDEKMSDIHKKMRAKISAGFNNREKSLQFEHLVSDFVISYQVSKGGVGSFELGECKIEMFPIMLTRKFPWLFIMITETKEKVNVFFSCDLRKFTPEYLEKIKKACFEAEAFVCNEIEKELVDYIGDECINWNANSELDNIVLI